MNSRTTPASAARESATPTRRPAPRRSRAHCGRAPAPGPGRTGKASGWMPNRLVRGQLDSRVTRQRDRQGDERLDARNDGTGFRILLEAAAAWAQALKTRNRATA